MGIEATGHTHWFEAMLAELGHELWGGDAARIRASVIRKQKTDARDAEHLLNLLPQVRLRSGQALGHLFRSGWHSEIGLDIGKIPTQAKPA